MPRKTKIMLHCHINNVTIETQDAEWVGFCVLELA
jgi:hypothetical protein